MGCRSWEPFGGYPEHGDGRDQYLEFHIAISKKTFCNDSQRFRGALG